MAGGVKAFFHGSEENFHMRRKTRLRPEKRESQRRAHRLILATEACNKLDDITFLLWNGCAMYLFYRDAIPLKTELFEGERER